MTDERGSLFADIEGAATEQLKKIIMTCKLPGMSRYVHSYVMQADTLPFSSVLSLVEWTYDSTTLLFASVFFDCQFLMLSITV